MQDQYGNLYCDSCGRGRAYFYPTPVGLLCTHCARLWSKQQKRLFGEFALSQSGADWAKSKTGLF